MPKDIDHGYSKETPIKQECLRGLIRASLQIVASKLELPYINDRFLYMDLYAGNGMREGYPGSPLIFLEEVDHYHEKKGAPALGFEAFFFEKKPASYTRLHSNIEKRWGPVGKEICFQHKINLLCGNHYQTIQPVIERLAARMRKTMGMIYADPNGQPCFDLLQRLAALKSLDMVDIVINLPATRLKWFRRHKSCKFSSLLSDALKGIGKSTVIIRSPIGRDQWTMAICTNWKDFPKWKSKGFYSIEEGRGQAILRRLDYTEAERGDDWFTGELPF